MITDWGYITLSALQNLWQSFLGFIPVLLGAIDIFIIGWFIAVGMGKLVAEILKRIKFNKLLEKGSWDEALKKADIKVDASGFIGAIVKWVLVIVFLQVAVGIMGLIQFSTLLERVVGYLPNVIVAALVFVITVIVADIVEKIVRTAVEGVKVGYGHVVSAIVKWAIWIFAIVLILGQLNIGGILPQAIILGIIGFLAIAGGLAFGLGGREMASEILKDFGNKIKR